MCPHQHHPSPDFQQLMLPLHAMNHDQQYAATGAYAGTCWLDGFLMWPVPDNTTNCGRQDPHLDLESILGPPPTAADAADSPTARSDQRNTYETLFKASQGEAGTFCIHRSELPITLKPLSRPANVAGYWLPAPEDLEG
jgi:hypothetical protein